MPVSLSCFMTMKMTKLIFDMLFSDISESSLKTFRIAIITNNSHSQFLHAYITSMHSILTSLIEKTTCSILSSIDHSI